MTIFIVATKHAANDETLNARITSQFPTNYYEIGRGQWLVAFSGTAKELYSSLSPEYVQGQVNPLDGTVVFGIGGYWGVASRDMWEWIATKLGGKIA
jgi:hypothetical protein